MAQPNVALSEETTGQVEEGSDYCQPKAPVVSVSEIMQSKSFKKCLESLNSGPQLTLAKSKLACLFLALDYPDEKYHEKSYASCIDDRRKWDKTKAFFRCHKFSGRFGSPGKMYDYYFKKVSELPAENSKEK